MKSGTSQNTTWIVFDGEGKEIRFLTSTGNLTLKLVWNNVTNSAIRVSKVCDTNGENCKNISDLVSTGNTNNITINTWNGTNIRCTYENWQFNCDNTAPDGWVTVQTWINWFLCKYEWWQLVCNIDPNKYIWWTWTNWKLCKYTTVNWQKMISCDISLATWTNNNIRCTYQNNQLKCNNANPTTNITWQSWSLCKLSGSNALVCNQTVQSIINDIDVNSLVNTDTIIWAMVTTWINDYLCKRVCKGNLQEPERQWAQSLNWNQSSTWCHIECTATWWSSDWYWKISTDSAGGTTKKYLAIKDASVTWLYLDNNKWIYHDGKLLIRKKWIITEASNEIWFDAKWLRIWNYGKSLFTGAWLSVGWKVVMWTLWCSANSISIFATWAGQDNTSHYEILWKDRLLVWTHNHWYIFFRNNNKVGINKTDPMVTLSVDGWIQVGGSCDRLCNANTVWTITYYEEGTVWHFAWCKKTANNTYKWVQLDWTTTLTVPSATCNPRVPYNANEYGEAFVTECTL